MNDNVLILLSGAYALVLEDEKHRAVMYTTPPKSSALIAVQGRGQGKSRENVNANVTFGRGRNQGRGQGRGVGRGQAGIED